MKRKSKNVHNTHIFRLEWLRSYGGSWHGKKTANGEIFNENSLTAAHRTLPFGTRVRVTNLDNGKSVVVRINNRGTLFKWKNNRLK